MQTLLSTGSHLSFLFTKKSNGKAFTGFFMLQCLCTPYADDMANRKEKKVSVQLKSEHKLAHKQKNKENCNAAPLGRFLGS